MSPDPSTLAESILLSGTYRGYDGYVSFFRECLSAWGDYRMEPREVIDLGDRFVVFDRIVSVGAGSGAPLDQEHALVLLEAAGLREDPGSDPDLDFVLASYEWGNRERAVAKDWWHPDGEYVNAVEDPDHATHRGFEAIDKLFASWMEAYPDVTVEPLEARAGGDRVFVWVRFSG